MTDVNLEFLVPLGFYDDLYPTSSFDQQVFPGIRSLALVQIVLKNESDRFSGCGCPFGVFWGSREGFCSGPVRSFQPHQAVDLWLDAVDDRSSLFLSCELGFFLSRPLLGVVIGPGFLRQVAGFQSSIVRFVHPLNEHRMLVIGDDVALGKGNGLIACWSYFFLLLHAVSHVSSSFSSNLIHESRLGFSTLDSIIHGRLIAA